MDRPEEILRTEYSEDFDEIRKARLLQGYFKYGPAEVNSTNKLIDRMESLERRLRMYNDTGNTELLADIANFAMLEFMHPQHPRAHFKVLDDGQSHISGMGVNQMKYLYDME